MVKGLWEEEEDRTCLGFCRFFDSFRGEGRGTVLKSSGIRRGFYHK